MSSRSSSNPPPTGQRHGSSSSSSNCSESEDHSSSTIAGSDAVRESTSDPSNPTNGPTAGYARVAKYNPFAQWEFQPTPQAPTKNDKEQVLRKYQESSEVYFHDQYGVEISDDELELFKRDATDRIRPKDGSKHVIKDKGFDKWNMFTRSISNNNSGSTSPTSESLRKSYEIAVEEKNANGASGRINQLFENPPRGLISTEERLERGEAGILESDEFKESDNLHASFMERLRLRQKQINGFCERHKIRQWVIFVISVFITVCLCVILPIGSKIGLFEKKSGPALTSYIKITDYVYPTLSAIRTNMVDPDTPKSAMKRKSMKGEEWDLVFSDEFNAEGRTFYPGMDQFWEAVNIHYAATKDLEWYDPDAVVTKKGTLNLRMDNFKNHDLFYRSGMLQSWNKMCFSEGIMEVSAKMPGSAYTAGLWPGIWILGNLARPGYLASTDGVWPYSYNECDAGITPNQSTSDGLSYLPGQRLNKCTCKGEDHPNRGTGRGAPEIDLLEGAHSVNSVTDLHFGVAAQTLQVAPFDVWYLPNYDFVAVHNITKSNLNSYLGTPFQEMVSVQTTVNESWYENVVSASEPTRRLEGSQTYFQKYVTEYQSKSKDPMENYVRFFLGDEPTATIIGPALAPNGNVGWRDMPKEPMSIVLNLGLSESWSMIQWLNFNFPLTFEIDYVRIYQPKGARDGLTCNPPDYPTTEYINNHLNAYMNPNLTRWEDAGYTIPRNKLLNGQNC
ncbi:Beta-glucan synthesis-associated protein KRE6 [Cyberlindnera fabianii]|uniref:Beta-glucan synthesis-associated protein KRE6 n=1 Tax=Cyberlindnera fabianii TaxID=36022 RepID=A0A1V2L816_CYBFA|nr:Beta-glucan synthesis-associated protein KRE6 [Cyberlindnera fabianii]